MARLPQPHLAEGSPLAALRAESDEVLRSIVIAVRASGACRPRLGRPGARTARFRLACCGG